MPKAEELLELRAKKTIGALAPEPEEESVSLACGQLATSNGEHRIRLVKLSEVDEEPTRWLWPSRLPRGKLVILEGHPRLGKSTLTTAVAAAVSAGGSIAGHRLGAPEDVLMLSYEDARADTLVPRLLAAGGDASRVHLPELRLSEGLEIGLQLPTHVAELEQVLHERGIRPALVVVDPLGEALSSTVDAHRESEVRHALAVLVAFARRTDACVMLVRHLRKQSTGRAVTSGGGSIGFSAAARVVLRIDEEPDAPSRRLLSIVKNNLAAKDPTLSFELVSSNERSVATVRWNGEVDWSADELDGVDATLRSDDRSEVRAWLRAQLSGCERSSRDVHSLGSEKGFSRSSIERASVSLKVNKRAQGLGKEKRSTWSLPAVSDGEGAGSAGRANSPSVESMHGFQRVVVDLSE